MPRSRSSRRPGHAATSSPATVSASRADIPRMGSRVRVALPRLVNVVPHRVDTSSQMLGLGPLRPLLAFIAVAFAAISIQLDGTNWRLVGVAGLAAASLVLVAAAVPWERVPPGFLLAPALGTLGVIAILRESEGGASSGFGPL